MEHIQIEPLPVTKDEPLKELQSFVDACAKGARRGFGADGVKALKLARDIMDFIRKHA